MPKSDSSADAKASETVEVNADTTKLTDKIQEARQRMGEAAYSLAVLHYHRLCILEALGKTEESAADRKWLEERGVPITEQLH